jgi:type I restriction enzyme M protein
MTARISIEITQIWSRSGANLPPSVRGMRAVFEGKQMAKRAKAADQSNDGVAVAEIAEDGGAEGSELDLVPEGTIVCVLTGEHRLATPQEETLQSFAEQLHREYGIPFENMNRDVKVPCVYEDPRTGKEKTRQRNVSLVVYEDGTARELTNIIRVGIIQPNVKPGPDAIGVLDDVLGNLSQERAEVFGFWTNGTELAFRMRTFHARSGRPVFTDLTDVPAPDENLVDLETGTRRPLRVATGDSLLRTFRRCHDYLYGNQSMRGDRAFWQLLFLIFCKIHDEQQSSRNFFVGATEANTEEGLKRVAKRIKGLFEQVQTDAYRDVFDGSERIELNDRALAYVAGELGRYSLLSTDTDAKGLAYEAITSTTLKRERGQFFTPRNVIRMMIEMVDPQEGKKILDPACGSGGFLVVALTHVRRQFLERTGGSMDVPVPKELKRVDPLVRKYAKGCLYGVDVDPDLRKAARMNMVMNNDGHGNILNFNSLEYGVAGRRSREMDVFEERGGGHGKFDYLFTNPPFGSKIPVTDPVILAAYDLGHSWERNGGVWQRVKPLKQVPPEILFIEACHNFLKPGTGIMAIILPDGILGNPGEQMEAVRWWMMRHMELIASVDLPAETFLPQVSVQASCVFLRRRDTTELKLLATEGPQQRPVFMAVAENVGHGRRGETRYVRGPDGQEAIVTRDVIERWELNGKVQERTRRREMREIADDLPWITDEFRKARTQA